MFSALKKPFSYSLLIVVVACCLGIGVYHAFAEDAPPRPVQESADSIVRNQKRISELRPYVEEFESLKGDNARNVGRMEAFGWTYDWSKNRPVKIEGF